MGDIAHHYIIYNMKSRCDFGAYGEISATGENGFENFKICIFCTLNAEKQQKSRKNALFSQLKRICCIVAALFSKVPA